VVGGNDGQFIGPCRSRRKNNYCATSPTRPTGATAGELNPRRFLDNLRQRRPTGMTAPRLTFKEMCARFEVTPRTLRYYEYIELLRPEREGRSRFFTTREVGRMKLIMRGRRFGFSLEEIRQWLEMYNQCGTAEQLKVWIEMADRQLVALRAQRDQLDATITELHRLRDETAQNTD
jgi:DNA-binding transcriptional MerR regulator